MSNATDTLRRAISGQTYLMDRPSEALDHLERCEDAIMQIALSMVGSEWDADLIDYVADIVSRVAPHPGDLHDGRDPATGVGPIEQYMHDLTGYDFTVYQSDIIDAQGADDEMLGEWEGEES